MHQSKPRWICSFGHDKSSPVDVDTHGVGRHGLGARLVRPAKVSDSASVDIVLSAGLVVPSSTRDDDRARGTDTNVCKGALDRDAAVVPELRGIRVQHLLSVRVQVCASPQMTETVAARGLRKVSAHFVWTLETTGAVVVVEQNNVWGSGGLARAQEQYGQECCGICQYSIVFPLVVERVQEDEWYSMKDDSPTADAAKALGRAAAADAKRSTRLEICMLKT